MAQYIDKSALVAEIEKLENVLSDPLMKINGEDYINGGKKIIKEMKSFLNTIEVKEVDLNKEIEEYLSIYWSNEKDLHPFLGHVANHFFALGMAVSNKAQKGEDV